MNVYDSPTQILKAIQQAFSEETRGQHAHQTPSRRESAPHMEFERALRRAEAPGALDAPEGQSQHHVEHSTKAALRLEAAALRLAQTQAIEDQDERDNMAPQRVAGEDWDPCVAEENDDDPLRLNLVRSLTSLELLAAQFEMRKTDPQPQPLPPSTTPEMRPLISTIAVPETQDVHALHDLSQLSASDGRDDVWELMLNDQQLPVSSLELERRPDGGLRATLQSSDTDHIDAAQEEASLRSLRQRLSEMGVQVNDGTRQTQATPHGAGVRS